MKRKTTIIRSAVAAASAVGLSLAAPVMAKGDKTDEQQQGAQMETEESLQQDQEKVSGEEQKVGGEEHKKDKSAQKAAIDPKQVQKVFGSDVQVISIEDLPQDQITKLQEELQALGLYRGRVDGKLGPQTRNALNSFVDKQSEINEQLLRSGQVTTQMMDALGVSHSDVQPVKGEEESLDQPIEQPKPEEQGQEPQEQPAEPQTAPQPEGQMDEGTGEPVVPQDDTQEPQY